jgi:hypothetical protein
MARAVKNRAQAEKQPQGSSDGSSSASRDPTQRSTPKSIPRFDGNRDPSAGVLEYTRPTDLKSISEFLGLAGWYAARGVSTNALLSQPVYACTFSNKHSQAHSLGMQTGSVRLAASSNTYKTPLPRHFSLLHSVILSSSIFSFILTTLYLYITWVPHCLPFPHHDFFKSYTPLLPGYCVLPTPTCEHWN